MKILARVLYLAAFVAMAGAAALALDRALRPSMSAVLLQAVILGGVLGAAGLVHRRAWGASLVLLPIGAYVLLRTVLPPAQDVEGVRGLYHFYVNALGVGADEYTAKYFPLSLTGAPELRLMLATLVYCLVGVASFLALSLRRPVPGVALSLLLVGFSFTVDTAPRVLGLAVVFLVLAACVLVLSRSLERRTWRLRDAFPGVLMAAAGAALAVVVLSAAPSAAAAPWEDWREWNPFNQGGSVYSFNWLQDYPKLLDPARNVVIIKVESAKPSYWRANALDQFNGEAWISSQTYLKNVPRIRTSSGYVYTIPAAAPTPAGTVVTERFQVRSLFTNYFFAGGDPSSLTVDQNVTLRMNDSRSLHVVNSLGPPLDYTVKAEIPTITPSSLVGLGRDYPESVTPYLELPFPRLSQIRSMAGGADGETAWRGALAEALPSGEQWVGLYALNQKIVGEATDPYQVTLRLEVYLRQNYHYTLEPPANDFSSPYAAFLFDTKAGYCQHFAGVMAMLLRFNGIPARVAVGFTSGELESAGIYSVSTNNAHAWVEAYFPTVGWLAFDPTPGRSLPTAGASSTSPGFKDPFVSSSSGSTTATTVPRDPLRDDSRTPAASKPDSGGASWISQAPWLPWLVGALVLLVAWPFGRNAWRERGLRFGSPAQRFATSLRLLRGSVAAYGMAATGSSTFEDVVDLVEGHLGLQCEPALMNRAGAVLFGGRAALPDDLRRAEEFRHRVQTGLRKRHGWLKSLLTWYGMPAARRSRRAAEAAGGEAGAPARSPARVVRSTAG